MIFYLGSSNVSWLYNSNMRLMVSRRRLEQLKSYQRASARWVLDSGGFTELSIHGRWTLTASEYLKLIQKYEQEIGGLDWAAPQDWMCEPHMIAKTGLSVSEHQRRTVDNFLELRNETPLVIPVLQGFSFKEYAECYQMYLNAGVDLSSEPVVGLGSVCRRQATDEIGYIVSMIRSEGLRLHGFGCKTKAIRLYGEMLHSADSMAWSIDGRYEGTCTHKKSRCNNCLHWAIDWRTKLLAGLPGAP